MVSKKLCPRNSLLHTLATGRRRREAKPGQKTMGKKSRTVIFGRGDRANEIVLRWTGEAEMKLFLQLISR